MGLKICLGTVQQGMDYGIYGGKKPHEDESAALYDFAVSQGIDIFDTAAQYGNAEYVVGRFLRSHPEKNVRIISKLSPNALSGAQAGDYENIVESELRKSLNNLSLEHIHGFMLHNPEQVFNNDILTALDRVKQSGLINYIGASVYTPAQALAAATSPLVDYIQIPYNVLDRRLDKTDFFKLAKGNGKTIFARSVFLQGLLLMDAKNIASKLPGALPYVTRFQKAATGLPLNGACMAWCRYRPEIDYLVLGVTGIRDLKENMTAFDENIENYAEFICGMKQDFPDVPENIVRPDLWEAIV